MSRHSVARDQRGIETVVSHVMSVGITTLLIISLVATAAGFLDTHNTRAAREELDTVANRLATSLEGVDRLARHSDGATVTVDLPETVAGRTYTAELVHGACGAISTSTCIRVEAGGHDLSTIVAVKNETTLSLSGDAGRYVVASNGSAGTRITDLGRIEMSSRIGVGHDFQSPVTTGRAFRQEPVARFEINRSLPRQDEPVQFDASQSLDPIGNISYYEWDWDDDGNFEANVTDPAFVKRFSSTGTKNVTLKVTDDTDLTDTANATVHVAGLNLTQNFTLYTAANTNAINFTIKNDHQVPVNLTHLLIDPVDPTQDHLSENRPPTAADETNESPHEIAFDKHVDGSIDDHIEWDAGIGERLEIQSEGALVELAVKRDGTEVDSEVLLARSESVRVSLHGFPNSWNPNSDRITVGFSYWVIDKNNAQSVTFSGEVQPASGGP